MCPPCRSTVDGRKPPPLGELPIPSSKGSGVDGGDTPVQTYSAVAAEPCLLLSGGVAAAEVLIRLLATPVGVAIPEAPDEVRINENAPPRAMNLLHALAAMQQKIQATAPAPTAMQQAAGGHKLKALMAFGGASKTFKGFGTNIPAPKAAE